MLSQDTCGCAAQVYYVVDNPSWGGMMWKGGKGRVTGQMLKEHLPPPSLDNLVMVCGPPGMMNAVSGNKAPDKSQGELTGLLKELGYTKDNELPMHCICEGALKPVTKRIRISCCAGPNLALCGRKSRIQTSTSNLFSGHFQNCCNLLFRRWQAASQLHSGWPDSLKTTV
eukprot:366009-Chlamydomonas_euryale.AAC.24